MRNKIIGFKNLLKRLGFLGVIPFILWPLFFLLVILVVFRTEYDMAMTIVEDKTTIEAYGVAEDFKDYIGQVTMIVDTACEAVDDMLRQGDSVDQVQKYLERKTLTLSSIASGDTKGIYGYVKGQFVDGDNWVPGKDYVPTERVWYKEAVKADGDKVIIDPYIDARTGKLVVTAAKLLSDKESVIAIDIWLSRMQQMTEDVACADPDHEVMIMDDEGNIVSHSIPEEVGENYRDSKDPDKKKIYVGLRKSGGKVYTIHMGEKEFLLCPRKIFDNWTVITMHSAEPAMQEIHQLTRTVMISAIIGIILTLAIVFFMTAQKVKIMNYGDNVQSIANIYVTMHKVDLDTHSFEVVACKNKRIVDVVKSESFSTADEIMKVIADKVCDDRSKKEVIEFLRLDNLDQRMDQLNTISIEFLTVDHRWNRGRFIVAERKSDGTLKSVIWAVEDIDAERRSRDELIYLAETDQLTMLNNRGSGETKIRNMLRSGEGGMFVLLDVDRFKSINDNFGHHVGDKVLVAIGDAIHKTFREKDITLRLGGDEFAAFTPGIYSMEAGKPVVKRLISAIESMNVPELSGMIVNVSVGVAFYQPDDNYSFEELYKHADSCSYESKKAKGSFATFFQNPGDF
ncbi:MAG: diguanylate cyclase [Butyrivibrio sp.]|nr:diguanylate cyclase [Butyrivibrio sp.]MBR1642256.1 diguanylate cyclase [Butyrivibrio sp.]